MATRVDPVCGREVEESVAESHGLISSHLGRRYFFCSSECHRRFVGDARPFIIATDIICGREVSIDDAEDLGLYADHANQRRYFCSQQCRAKFELNPDNPPGPSAHHHGDYAAGEPG